MAVNFKVDTSKLVGVIRVMQGDVEPGGNNDFALYIWSDPFDMSIFYKDKLNLSKWCSLWPNLDGAFSSDGELRCPCNLQSALVDGGRFEPSPRCSNTVQDSCSDDNGIVHCVRSSSPSSNGEGLECCYDVNGNLANIADNLYAGYIHRYHYLGTEPFDQTGTAPYFSHYTSDVLPYIRCCSTRSDCDRYFIPYRPSQDCNGYQPPTPGRLNGDPHILTLDGLAYTFNGHGEYVLIDALGGLFEMQGRTEPIKNGTTPIKATRFTAIAAKFNNDTMVHVALNQVRGLVAYTTEDYVWSRIDFDDNPIWSGTGLTIFYTKATNETSVSITVAFDFGLSFVVEANNDLMSIIVYGPEMLHGNTSGLLGNWNDDVTDDLRTPNGDIIPSNSSLQDIHYDFGEKWRIDSEDSILYYVAGTDYSTYYKPNFVPWFEAPDNIDQEEVTRVCGDNIECIFDYQVTGNVEIAKVTKDIVEFVEEIKEDVKPVVVCGFISTPQNGFKNGTTYTEGSILIFSCETGFNLTGESRIICTPKGVWSDLTPVCVDLCENVEAPENGGKQRNGQTIHFICEDGYTLNGVSSITCVGGTLSDSVPSCDEDTAIQLYAIIGLGLILAIAIGVLYWFFCRKNNKIHSHTEEDGNQMSGITNSE
ncbi:sushi domain-containing protein 2-like [Antedon mediterranea]|uniref:sushi domain-containing protein 2-like n=1 Tax=Antedon mediterranea TaxID=105859 RepID=UPI003AF4E9F6